jgi:iron complex outermembrane recepter protein
MTTSLKAVLLAGVAVSLMGASGAVAQDQPSSPPAQSAEQAREQNEPLSPQDATDPVTEATQDDDVEGVVVTARRREESLQDVPIAVSAFSEERLEQAGAQDITTLQKITPNTTVQIARGSNTTLIAFIRGVGQQDPLPGFEPGVGLYIDDVYVARPQGAVLDIFDIQRIEVLRGPQGTLYGRNTIGGAIKYVTEKIGAEPELTARVQLGTYDQRDFIVSGDLPLGNGFGISGAVASYHRDGYGRNLFTGAEHYNRETLAGRLSAEWVPNANLFFRLAYDRVDDDSNPRHGHREVPAIGLTGPIPNGAVLDNEYDTRAGIGDRNSVVTEGLSLLAQWQLNETITLKSITAGRRGETTTVIDFDNEPQPLLDIPATYDDQQFTQEFQLLYEGERLQGVLGVYYLDGEANNTFDTILGGVGLTIGSINNITTESLAVFGDFSFDVTEQLSVSAGGRFTRDDKTGRIFRANYSGPGGQRSPLLGGPARPPLAIRTNYTASRTDEQFTPRVSVRYEFNPDLTAYASYSRGFKSGGFDPRGDAISTPQTVEGFEPETVDAYEVGVKGSALDRRLNFAAAVFASEYQDQQVTTQVPLPPPAVGIASFVDNVGNSSIRGIELEGNFRITDNLTAVGSLGFIEAEFNEFTRFNLVTRQFEDISEQVVFQNTPDWTHYFALTYSTNLPDGSEFSFTPSVSYRGPYSQFEFPNPLVDQDAFALVDAVVSLTSPDGRLRASLQGRNLTDERYRVGAYNFPGPLFGNSVIGFYGPPRTLTAVFEVRF